MQDLSKISVVLPSLDPDEKLIAVVDGLLEYGFSDIILVNDGSKQENFHYFTNLAAQHPEITPAPPGQQRQGRCPKKRFPLLPGKPARWLRRRHRGRRQPTPSRGHPGLL